MKTVEVFGRKYKIKDKFNWVAVDSNGQIYAYRDKPKINGFGTYYPTDPVSLRDCLYGKLYEHVDDIPSNINLDPILIEVK